MSTGQVVCRFESACFDRLYSNTVLGIVGSQVARLPNCHRMVCVLGPTEIGGGSTYLKRQMSWMFFLSALMYSVASDFSPDSFLLMAPATMSAS